MGNNYNMTVKASLIILVMMCILSCDNNDYKNIEIEIIRVKKVMKHGIIDQEGVWLRHARIEFKVHNTGDKDIEGWKIFFRISTDDSKQLEAYQKRYYDIKAGEASEPMTTDSAAIPTNYGDPANAVVKHFEVW